MRLFSRTPFQATRRLSLMLPLIALLGTSATQAADPVSTPARHWVSSWTASSQPVWGTEFPFPTNIPAHLSNQTIRETARISLGGERVRIVLSNAYGQQPLQIGAAEIALADTGGIAIKPGTSRTVTFSGQRTATIPPGAPLISDPVDLPVAALSTLAVSLYLPDDTPSATFHWDGRQTTWIVPGNQVSATHFESGQTTTARLYLSGIQVETRKPARVVAILGDSITDGNTATLDANTRWPDFLAARLAPHNVAVINGGISGARLLSDAMGVNALARFERDALSPPGVEAIVVLIGINDISWTGTPVKPTGALPTLDELTAGYRQLIAQAHNRGIRIIGATLTPFEGAMSGTPMEKYYNTDKDALRKALNTWIRTSGAFDAVIDFDAITRDPSHPLRFRPAYDSGDHLHPSDAGSRAMADAVDLKILIPSLKQR